MYPENAVGEFIESLFYGAVGAVLGLLLGILVTVVFVVLLYGFMVFVILRGSLLWFLRAVARPAYRRLRRFYSSQKIRFEIRRLERAMRRDYKELRAGTISVNEIRAKYDLGPLPYPEAFRKGLPRFVR